jgi:hypothetical protein
LPFAILYPLTSVSLILALGADWAIARMRRPAAA